MDKYLIAHDLGTSGDKASLFSIEGKLVKAIRHLTKRIIFIIRPYYTTELVGLSSNTAYKKLKNLQKSKTLPFSYEKGLISAINPRPLPENIYSERHTFAFTR